MEQIFLQGEGQKRPGEEKLREGSSDRDDQDWDHPDRLTKGDTHSEELKMRCLNV